MTDGFENSSKKFFKEQIQKMVSRQQEKYGWHFTFLGANQDASAEADALGIDVEEPRLPVSGTGGSGWPTRMRNGSPVDGLAPSS
jgi:hypothetical protein